MQINFLIVCLILLPLATNATLFNVRGTLSCQGEPYVGGKVQLWDQDWPDDDDKLGEERSAPDGTFMVEGEESEIGGEDPYLLIEHVCPQNGRPLRENCHVLSRMDIRDVSIQLLPMITLDGQLEYKIICENVYQYED